MVTAVSTAATPLRSLSGLALPAEYVMPAAFRPWSLEEANRLEHLFDVCGTAAFGAGGCFICKAVDAQGYAGRCERHVLTVTNYGQPGEPLWLIHL